MTPTPTQIQQVIAHLEKEGWQCVPKELPVEMAHAVAGTDVVGNGWLDTMCKRWANALSAAPHYAASPAPTLICPRCKVDRFQESRLCPLQQCPMVGEAYTASPIDDLSVCPQCYGPADNGHDRCIPPSAYMCSKCCAQEDADKLAAAQEELAKLKKIKSLISDDSFAISFQSFGQYRTALLKVLNE